MAALCEEELDPEQEKISLNILETDSDSGQGSCEMVSPDDQSKQYNCLEDEDSDEEILASRKCKNKKILVESDSDGEIQIKNTENSNISSDNEEEDKKNHIGHKGKPRRIRSLLLDSDNSENEDETQVCAQHNEEELPESNCVDKDISDIKLKESNRPSKQTNVNLKIKPKSKSKRSIEKDETSVNGKSSKQKVKMLTEDRPLLNDSGCLLTDGDLFENEVGDEMNSEEEESLDAIRANVKDKIKSHSSRDYDSSDHEEEDEGSQDKEKRKERKAARLGKEAIKQMHSETQRLIRESSVSLPYHLPEPKTIHDFFKRRPRPGCQGNAMQLIKSSKYQPSIVESKNTNDTVCTDAENCDSVLKKDFVNLEQLPHESLQMTALDDAQKDAQIVGVYNPTDPFVHKEINAFSEKSNGQPNLVHEQEPSEVKVANETTQTVFAPRLQDQLCESIQHETKNLVATEQILHKPKLSRMEKLRALGIDVSIKPRLCPDNGSFVNLDEPKHNKELEALKERFLKHSLHKVKPVKERKMNLNIVRKETNAEGKEELKSDIVPVVMAAENVEDNKHGKPGEKLQVLKLKLQEAMKIRRSEERQKRLALYKLDNEDGFVDDEEEEEMTDEEEDELAEDVDNLLGGKEDENEEDDDIVNGLSESVPEITFPFPQPVMTDSSLLLFKDNSTKMGDSLPDKIEPYDDGIKRNLRLEEEDSLLPQLKENSHNSSFELIGSMIPSYQPCNKTARGAINSNHSCFRSPSPVHFKTSFLSSASKSSGKMSEPSLPVEDSQDLYNNSPEPKASYLCAGGNSQFQFSLEDDTQSQLLDADGFLNVGPRQSKFSSTKHRLILDTMDENAMDANMGELLDLCSGQFKDSLSSTNQADENEGKKEAMEELLDLCSGKFVSQVECSTQDSSASPKNEPLNKKDQMPKAITLCSGSFATDRDQEDEEEEFKDFQLLPYDDSESENGEEEDNRDDENDDDEEEKDDEEILRQQQKKRKLRMTDFMEDEAELSGSDIGSEDDYEEEDDEYEEEALDEDLPSDEELQDQVNKIHMKVTMDEDQRQLRLYQERYLADGDLHSDGPGRTRKFRWKHLDDASQLDMFRRDSEMDENDGDNEEVEETELKWRKERFEREQWLREQSQSGPDNNQEEDIGEDSQFMKLAKKVTAKALQKKGNTEATEIKKPASRNSYEVIRPNMRTGSLLNKPKEVLQKLASVSELNPNAPRNSRNFVFQTLSPGKKAESTDKLKLKIRKNISVALPSPKRFRKENSPASKNRSIFQLLEKSS
ncbi:hypothetical protein GDO86_003579 [Hymenochirus boettgeri]|uniref:Claspin n=1 Tax=Hymenochirus boettgeri TaxID=247094 RepID=A0A8T2KA15_9PIPI|nr:hypothetical protein GDO86_003579 [Hymenochirus boettgeri]